LKCSAETLLTDKFNKDVHATNIPINATKESLSYDEIIASIKFCLESILAQIMGTIILPRQN
jgi:hypothetical protein